MEIITDNGSIDPPGTPWILTEIIGTSPARSFCSMDGDRH